MGKRIYVDDMKKFQELFPELSYTNVWAYDKKFVKMLRKNKITYHIEDHEPASGNETKNETN